MKNKFLLLGATALLSTGALLANAETLGTPGTINAEVNLRVIPTITGTANLNFGNIQVTQDPQAPEIIGFTAEIDASTGEIEVSENATALGGHAKGSLQIQGINVITDHSSGTVAIEFSDIDEFEVAAGSGSNAGCNEFEVNNIVSNLEDNIVIQDGTYYFGGTLSVPSGSASFDGPSLRCIGSGTATLIYAE